MVPCVWVREPAGEVARRYLALFTDPAIVASVLGFVITAVSVLAAAG